MRDFCSKIIGFGGIEIGFLCGLAQNPPHIQRGYAFKVKKSISALFLSIFVKKIQC